MAIADCLAQFTLGGSGRFEQGDGPFKLTEGVERPAQTQLHASLKTRLICQGVEFLNTGRVGLAHGHVAVHGTGRVGLRNDSFEEMEGLLRLETRGPLQLEGAFEEEPIGAQDL